MPGDRVGQRTSFSSQLCTVRYIGPLEGQSGTWLGVEWDDPSRGKNNGELKGRHYFDCTIPSSGSFLRPNRSDRDPPQSFLEALRSKYSPDSSNHGSVQPTARPTQYGHHSTEGMVEFGSKVAEEVGFERIREKQSDLSHLRVAILDGQRITGTSHLERAERQAELEQISEVCQSISELDLSRSLLESWEDVVDILVSVAGVKQLRLNGNRLSSTTSSEELFSPKTLSLALSQTSSISLDDTLIPWELLPKLLQSLSGLQQLSLSSNRLSSIPVCPLGLPPGFTSLDLEANLFSNLSQLLPLIRSAPGLKSLNLRFNVITQIECAEPGTTCFPKTLSSLNLSFNRINNWRQIAALNIVFPGIRDLRISRNPLYEQAAGKIPAPEDEDYLDETSRYLLTVAHLPRLVTLNYATITAADRLNADLYYISRARTKITKLRETISGSEFEVARDKLLLEYPRWYELCDQYGESTNVFITEQKKERWMESRLISFTFLFTRSEGSAPTQKVLKIPRTTDIYRLKGIVWKLFGIPTPHVRLIWETDVWDPLEPDELSDGEDDGGDEGREGYGGDTGESDQKGHDQAKWKRREVELVDSPREVGFWIEGRGARVRVERS